jgi:hypothetical protein
MMGGSGIRPENHIEHDHDGNHRTRSCCDQSADSKSFHPEDDLRPSTYSRKIRLVLSSETPSDELSEKISRILFDIASALRENGCVLIGHIKALLDAGTRGHQFFSITGFGKKPRRKGELMGDILEAELVLNVIVYGVGRKYIEKAVDSTMKKYF